MSDEKQQTGSEAVAEAVMSQTDGNSIPEGVWGTLMKTNKDMFDEGGALRSDIGEGESNEEVEASDEDSMPEDPESEDSEEQELTDEEQAEVGADDDEGDGEPEIDDEDLADARAALEFIGIPKDQLEAMSPEQILSIGERVALQVDGRESTQDESGSQKQEATAPSAFDFETAFSGIEPDMKDYLGDEAAGRFKKFLQDFSSHHEGRIAEAQHQAKVVERGQRVVAEGLLQLEKSFPQLDGNERLRKRVLDNVYDLAAAANARGKAVDPAKLFRKAALMEGLREGKAKPRVSSRAVTNGQPKSAAGTPRKRTPKSKDAWERQFLHLTHEKGMSRTAAERQLGPMPRT